ncbi:ran GTPase-activating protein 1-like [Chenopodium quinoa]|uniref:ran GTPase-activating protein 1-like n=1 Tax=Chenopodium quinoa TaxID=63459 RepID=UPI000B76C383|nr:ran GTPase-activating protein 1-like [Chenopodium quinoa]
MTSVRQTRGGEEKNSGKGKTQVVEGDTSESEEEESESEKEESKEKREEDKEEEEISEGEPQEADSEKEEETQRGLRRSKRKIVKPATSTLKPVIIEDISSSDHSDPDFTPTQVPFASEPSSVKAEMEQLIKMVCTKLEDMAKQLASLQRQVQAVADAQATSFTGMENKVDAAEKNIMHSTQEILETINRVSFEEVEEASNDPITPADEPTYSP